MILIVYGVCCLQTCIRNGNMVELGSILGQGLVVVATGCKSNFFL